MRKPRVSIPPAALDQMVAEYVSGTHSTTLALRYGVTQPTIVYHLRKRGIPRRSRAETNRMRAPFDQDELLRRVNEGGLSLGEIAAQLGVSKPTVERELRRLGVKSKRGRGSPLEKNFFWQGGVRTDTDRYVMVRVSDHPCRTHDGYVREHRLVMERLLGRYLLPAESVHHKDGDPANNDPANLMLFATHAEHMRHEWRERWAARLLRQRENHQSAAHRPASPNRSASETDADLSP